MNERDLRAIDGGLSERRLHNMILDRPKAKAPGIVEPWLPRGLTLLVGPAGAGKTLVLNDIGLRTSSGGELLGTKLDLQYRAMILDLEQMSDMGLERLSRLARGHGLSVKALADAGWLSWNNTKLDLTLQDDRNFLHGEVQRLGIDVLLIDSLSRLHSGNENDGETMRPVMKALEDLRRYCDVLVSCHPRKRRPNERGRPGLSAVRGHSCIAEAADAVWMLNDHELRLVKDRADRGCVTDPFRIELKVDENNDATRLVWTPASATVASGGAKPSNASGATNVKQRPAQRPKKRAGRPEWTKIREAAKEMESFTQVKLRAEGFARSTVHDVCDALVQRGDADRTGNDYQWTGKGTTPWTP